MSKKTHDYWRPHEPPLNWHTPGHPVIRKVIGWPDDFPPARPLRDSEQAATGSVAVTLTNGHWICILQTLHHYGRAHGDADWKKWRMQVRRAILGVVNPNLDDEKPVAVKLSIEDWRTIWEQVRTACQERGGRWIAWFHWLSQTMIAQIKGD